MHVYYLFFGSFLHTLNILDQLYQESEFFKTFLKNKSGIDPEKREVLTQSKELKKPLKVK